MDGVLPLLKPKGPTSHDCVFKLRKLLGQKKIGHTGTLDPEVEGVLPICLGEGTKVIPFLSSHQKTYIADIKLGEATTTEDHTGETIKKEYVMQFPNSEKIKEILLSFIGEISQVPPMYSAVKVNGKKLYEYARAGIDVERPVRQIMIHDITLLQIDPKQHTIRMRVDCSKGTYIRTLCVDIGEKLGYPAHMSSLVRTESDGIQLAETVDFETVEQAVAQQNIEQHLLTISRMLTNLDALEVDSSTAQRVLYGQKLPISHQSVGSEPFKMMYQGKLLAIYETKETMMKPVRVFNLNK